MELLIGIAVVFFSALVLLWFVWPILQWLGGRNKEEDAKAAQKAADRDFMVEIGRAEGGEEAWEEYKAAAAKLLHVLGRRTLSMTHTRSNSRRDC